MAAWFNAISTKNPNQRQLYKLGGDGSVTTWTANPGLLGLGLDPTDLTSFNGAVWFDGTTPLDRGRTLLPLEPLPMVFI